MQFEFALMETWPVLAWLARCSRNSSAVTVFHGQHVETHPGFFCEAAWAGDYADQALAETDIVAGTGGKISNGRALFVASASTVDRLVYLTDGDSAWVSNSLPCLVAALKARVDPTYNRYYADFYSVVEGLSRYKRRLATTAGTIELSYFHNLAWDGHSLTQSPKPFPLRDFGSFPAYRDFLQGAMQAMASNLRSPYRRVSYRMLGTISTGYDSPTVAALAQEAGCSEALCFDKAHTGEDDSGELIARHLGIQPIRVADRDWRSLTLPEVPFVSANAMGEEVRFSGATAHLRQRLLLTGYHGDKMWSPHTTALSPDIVRGDPSGLALSEYRLWAGFIHCPVPFWGARQIRDVNQISRSSEMRPWDIGGDYTRPICRRIVEGRGVPRELFGQRKRNASVMLHNYEHFLAPSSAGDFLQWVRTHRGEWIKRGRVPPLPSPLLDRLIHFAVDSFSGWAKTKPGLWRLAGRLEGRPTYLRRLLFPWAIERASERYSGLERA